VRHSRFNYGCVLLSPSGWQVHSKGLRNNTKQTVQFKYEDVSFFRKNTRGQLRCLPRNAPDHLIATADGATLKLDNQKNGWKGVCVYHESNGNRWHCLVRALARCYLHLCTMGANAKTFLSAYFDEENSPPNRTSPMRTSAEPSKWQQRFLITQRHEGSLWIVLTPTRFVVGERMPSPLRATRIPRFRKWVDGGEPCLRSIFGRSSLVSPRYVTKHEAQV
jgi:hypothetical protein